MPTLAVVNFNIVCATLGGFITLFGLVSYLLKENFYLSEALISTVAGVIFSPHATNLLRPLEYANGNQLDLETITLYFTRLVLGVQLVLAGVQLPHKYLWKERKSLLILLGPGMCIMWISTALLVWALVPHINLVMAISIAACVTPTDPVLSNSIVKGKFADKSIPPPLQKIITGESGANDGLGYPFLFLGLYLLKFAGEGGMGQHGNVAHAMELWVYESWVYQIFLSVAYGAVVGWVAKELLHWAEARHYVDRESFLVFAITLALFIIGTVGMFGSDDVLACFIAGNAFTWDDWFRLETMDDSLQPTIDMLLNVAVFLWFGAVCPWHKFVDNSVIPTYRLILLGILVLLLRRLPGILALHKTIHQVEHWRHAIFVGFFGPIGVSAIFYLYIAKEFLREIQVNGSQRADAKQLSEAIETIVWFLAVCSIFVHGISIPVGKLGKMGIHLPRTISTALSSERVSRTATLNEHHTSTPFQTPLSQGSLMSPSRRSTTSAPDVRFGIRSLVSVFRRTVQRLFKHKEGQGNPEEDRVGAATSESGSRPEISNPRDGRVIRKSSIKPNGLEAVTPDSKPAINSSASIQDPQPIEAPLSATPTNPVMDPEPPAQTASSIQERNRSVRFPDEPAQQPAHST